MTHFFNFGPGSSALRRAGVAVAALILGFSVSSTPAAQADLLVPTACQDDLQGANDQPGQKDITLYCAADGDGAPYDYHTIVNWDDVSLSGGNTADVCTLYDWNDNALVDFAVCVTLAGGAGDTAVLNEVRLFICNDTKVDRCSGATLLPPAANTTCTVSQEQTDPFSPAAVDGPGDSYPMDTRMLCAIDVNEFGTLGAYAVLIDACSYPSHEPNSDPSDCVAFKQCTSNNECDDGNVCTQDRCTPAGICSHKPRNGRPACDDGLFCNGDDACNRSGLCEPGVTPRNCNDGVSCTVDSCDEVNDICGHEARNSLCTNTDYCDGVETCDPVDDCRPGVPVNCGDNVGCTVDTCNEATDSCDHAASDAACDDGQYCDGPETCNAQTGCQSGVAPNCNDGVTCTTDTCNEAQDSCVNTPNNGACSDNLWCTGTETCDAVNGCQPGTPPDCVDGVPCTNDSCNEAADRCDHAPDGGQCQDGEFCDGVEVCDPVDGCGPGPDPCPVDLCNENTDECVQCLTNSDCNNGNFCDGVETCNVGAGVCVPGTPPNCNDGFGCTTDTCNENTDTCDHAANDAACSDGQFCNGSEVCTLGEGCQAGSAPDCDDAVGCTVDACDEVGDQCTHATNDDACDNDLFCDGSETCDAVQGCLAGTAPDCGDAFGCTGDFCNEDLDRCDHSPDNEACQDGLFCNGAEVCDVGQGCIAGTPPTCGDQFVCTTDTCIEDTDSCAHDFSTCVCGDNEITGEEVCDPPATSGSFEDCDNGVDDDLDGEIDCRDKDCKPGARAPICDEGCTLDQVCTKFIRDPATIQFNRASVGLDEFYIHGRIGLSGNPDPLTEGMSIKVSNPYTTVFEAGLGFGDMLGRKGGRNFVFQDEDAAFLGQTSRAGGISMARLKFRLFKGRPYLVFTVRAYGDLLAADHWLMTTELSVGAERGFLTSEWKATRNGWKLHQAEF